MTPPGLKAHLVDPGVHAPAETRQCQCNASWGGLSCQGPAAARAALVGTAGAPPLICKGINLPVTLGRVWPPLCCLSHGASWLLCPPCHPAQPTLSPAALRAPEEGRHCRVPPPHQPFLASIWITFSPVLFMRTPLLLPTLRASSHLGLGGLSRFFILIIFHSSPCKAPGSAAWPHDSLAGSGCRLERAFVWPREQMGRAAAGGMCSRSFFPSRPAAPRSACACPGSAHSLVVDPQAEKLGENQG